MSIEKIHANFVSEAIAAKTLFADLAKVELYIAESYRARAFIELLQNADDAGAKKFIIRQVGDKLLVANDGRTFTSEDIVSLCRSGASTKQRGSGTIGYRGIGFKSVAGIATEVDVISGEYAFRFSKSATREAVSCEQDVPLIRIPHALSPNDAIWHVADEVRKLEHMTSIFVLAGLNHRMIVSEANDFDESALLFLKCINEVDIEMPALRRSLKRVASIADSGYSVERIGNGDSESHDWLVVSTPNGSEKLAFAFVDGRIAPTDRAHAVIHAFMPTLEYAGAFLKINGDFSTDPSRKSVDIDELSSASLERSLDLLADLARTAVTANKLAGFFSPFLSTAPHEGRFRKLLQLGLSQRLSSTPLQLGTRTGVVADIRLAPDWLTYNDFETLCQDVPHAPMTVLAAQPEINEFLRWLGSKTLTLDEALRLASQKPISPMGCGQLILRIARQFRFDLTPVRLDLLMTLRLLPTKGGYLCAREFSDQKLTTEFIEFLTNSAEIDDVRQLFRKLKIPDVILGRVTTLLPTVRGVARSDHEDSASSMAAMFKQPPGIKLWRSAEYNAQAWLSGLSGVLSVTDVSQANVGYDLEVIWLDGQRNQVEVKSVTRFGDPVRLTNNEHATAFQLGATYLLALVVNGSEAFDIRFVRDPIHTLALEKRCEQWSWYCENYLENMEKLNGF